MNRWMIIYAMSRCMSTYLWCVPLFHLCVNSLCNHFEVLLNILEFYFDVLLNMLGFYFEVLLNMLEFYFEVLLNMLELLLVHVVVFLTLVQPWLASIWSSRRGRLETATGGLLLPWAAPLLLPRVKRWEDLAATAPLLLPRARRRLHQTTHWRCGWSAAPLLLLYAWWLLLLQHAWWLLLLIWHVWRRLHPTTPHRTPRDTMMNAPTSKRWTHMYELFLDFNCLVQLLNVYTFIFRFKI
jgi:hypothetical protein